MNFLTFTPKKMLVFIYDKHETIVGMAHNPDDNKDGTFELKIASAITEDGRMSPLGSEKTKTLLWTYWKPFSFGQSKGIPTTGLGIYAHPENPILTTFNQAVLTQNKILMDKLRDYEREIDLKDREKRRIMTSSHKERIREAKILGEEVKHARGYYPTLYIPGVSEKFKGSEERELE